MRIRVLLFARLREIAGREALDLELPSGATVGEVWRHLQERTEALKGYPHPPLMNRDYAPSGTVLTGGEEVAFFPPVSGG